MYDRPALLAATPLEELADELLGPRAGSQRSPTWACPDPTHAQTGRTPPLNVFATGRGEQRWHCFGCGRGGSAIDLVMAVHGVDVRSAMDFLSARAGVKPDRPAPHAEITPRRPENRDPEGLARYVRRCTDQLWGPAGRPILQWLTHERAIPEDVLRLNRIGADVGDGHRPKGMPRAAGAVLPTLVDSEPIYAQIRVIHPGPDQSRYLQPTWDLAPNPKMCRLEPARRLHDEVIVTEGALDGLSAAAAGYVAVPVFGTSAPDEAVALALARLQAPLLIAFDPDGPGQAGATRLTELLRPHHRHPSSLTLPGGDLNDCHRAACSDWPELLQSAVAELNQERTPVAIWGPGL